MGEKQEGGSASAQTLIIGLSSAIAMCVHPTIFDLATPLLY